MSALESAFGHWVLKYRWLVIALSLTGVFLAASGGQYLQFTTNYRVFFSADNPELLAFDALEATYTKNDNVLFVITPRDGNVFTPDTLAAVAALTEQAWQMPYSIRVDSITNFQYTEARDDDLIVADLVADPSRLDDQALEKIKRVALSEPLLVNRLISEDSRVTAVNATVQLPGRDETREVPEVVSFARDLRDRIQAEYPGLDIRLTGMVLMNNAFSEASQNDMGLLVPISFAVMLVVLGLMIRGISGTIATVLVIAFSIVAAMGIGGYLGFPITPPSASSPIIILTVAIANCVHILTTLLYEMRHGQDKRAAIVESLRINLQPVFLASITTAIGFLTMNFSDVPPFRHLGNFVALGVLISFILATTFLPALMSLLPVRVKPVSRDKPDAFARLGDFVVARRNVLLWTMTAVVVTLIAFLPRNELNDIYVNYFEPSIDFRVDTDYTTENLTGIYVIDYSLQSAAPGGISDPGFLQDVEKFSQWFRQQPETIHVNSLTDIMKRLNQNMHGDDRSWYRLPEQRDLAAQYLLLYEMSLPYGLDLNNQINVDKSATRLTVTLQTLSTKEVLAVERRAAQWLKENAPHILQAAGSGPTVMFAHIGKRNIISMLGGTTIALILISMILVVALRSLKTGLVSMVPNLVPAAMGFGLWGIFVGEVGLALSVVSGMTLGIVVDDTVHFLSKYLRARREQGLGAPDAVRYAFRSVGRALFTTSVVLGAGFLVLALSNFKLNSDMGLLSAVVIVLALVADFLLLPPLLMKMEDEKNEDHRHRHANVDSAAA